MAAKISDEPEQCVPVLFGDELDALLLGLAQSHLVNRVGSTDASVIESVTARPVEEFERLIGDLTRAHRFLRAESQRVRRELTTFVNEANGALGFARGVTRRIAGPQNDPAAFRPEEAAQALLTLSGQL